MTKEFAIYQDPNGKYYRFVGEEYSTEGNKSGTYREVRRRVGLFHSGRFEEVPGTDVLLEHRKMTYYSVKRVRLVKLAHFLLV